MAISDVHNVVRKAYFSELSGIVKLDGKEILFADSFAPSENNYPYVILSSQIAFEQSTKCCKHYTASITLDIVTGSLEPNGRDDSETIGDKIKTIINPCDGQLESQTKDWTIETTELTMDTYITARNEPYYIYRKLLTFEHLITYTNGD